ncbi:Rap1b-like protein [Atractiella rhizophila]|nr:Rap1b-like protein [Atractiella rhizophila]
MRPLKSLTSRRELALLTTWDDEDVMTGKEFKIVMFGDGGVGKSALTLQFCHDLFVEDYDPTIEDSYTKSMIVDSVQCQCQIIDTAGTDQFPTLRDMYMKSADGFVLVFALNSGSSVKELLVIRENILRQKEVGVAQGGLACVLAGNKCDLVGERTVQRQVGDTLSMLWRVPYYEVSARQGINVDAIFMDIVRQVMKLDQAKNRQGNNFNKSNIKKKACIIS